MKFSCTRDNLSTALAVVSGVLGKPGHLPILSSVLLEATETGVRLRATDLEMAITAQVRARVESVGVEAVPGKTMADFVNLLSANQIDIELVENEIKIICGTSSAKIKGTSADEFPVIPDMEEGQPYLLPADKFRQALSQTLVAVARNEIRPELTGVYLAIGSERYEGLVLAATDSYRLAEKRLKTEPYHEPVTCIVPGRTVAEIVRLISTARAVGVVEENIRLWFSKNQIGLKFGMIEMVSRLLEGSYPDYAQIIPTQFCTSVSFPIEVFVKKVRAASLFTTAGVNAVVVDVKAEVGVVCLSSTSTQTGEQTGEVEAKVEGQENSILLNHKYIIDGLQQLEGEEAVLQMNSGDAPCVFRGKEDTSYVYIVMPIRQ